MSKDLNKVQLIGRLGQDPELRYTGSSVAVVNATLATSEKWKEGEHTEWNRLVLWDKLAEIIAQYCQKGSRVYIEGALRTRDWEKDGIKRYVTEIRVSDMIMLDSQGDRPAQTERPSAQPKPQEPSQDDGFDDIPFS